MRYASMAVVFLGLGGSIGSNLYLSQIEKENSLAQERATISLDAKIQEKLDKDKENEKDGEEKTEEEK